MKANRRRRVVADHAAFAAFTVTGDIFCAHVIAATFDGSQLSVVWAIPFAGILLSIALCPLLVPAVWHHHFGKISAAWSLAFFLPFAIFYGAGVASSSLVHALLAEYTKAPEVTRRRIYIETLQEVMPNIRYKIIVDEQTRSILPLLNLDSQRGGRP